MECVERGDLESEKTKRLVASFVEPLLNEGADVIVLGCTHYPFLRKIIEELAGPHVSLIDTGAAVAKQVQRRLGSLSLLNDSKTKSTVNFFSTGELSRVSSTISLLWEPGVLVEFDKIP